VSSSCATPASSTPCEPLHRVAAPSAKVGYCTVTSVWPAELTEIDPPQSHEHVEESSSAGFPSTVTLAEPGVHWLSMGWQGCGVSVPYAAEVALATCGLDIDVHMPNVGTFSAPKSVTAPAVA
jgi:hypothetical protein